MLIFVSRFRGNPRINRWIQDGVLQLQRRAYEAEGQGVWSKLDEKIPLTEPGKLLLELSSQNAATLQAGSTLQRASILLWIQNGLPRLSPSTTRGSSITTWLLDQNLVSAPGLEQDQTPPTIAHDLQDTTSPQLSSASNSRPQLATNVTRSTANGAVIAAQYVSR